MNTANHQLAENNLNELFFGKHGHLTGGSQGQGRSGSRLIGLVEV